MKKTLALLLAMVMILALCAACGSKDEAPAAEEAAPAAEEAAPAEAAAEEAAAVAEEAAAPAEGIPEASEEPTGEPVAELYPADGYDKTFEGYKAYAIDALKQDEHAPAEIVETTIETINAAEEGSDDAFAMLINQGLILSYDEFVG